MTFTSPIGAPWYYSGTFCTVNQSQTLAPPMRLWPKAAWLLERGIFHGFRPLASAPISYHDEICPLFPLLSPGWPQKSELILPLPLSSFGSISFPDITSHENTSLYAPPLAMRFSAPFGQFRLPWISIHDARITDSPTHHHSQCPPPLSPSSIPIKWFSRHSLHRTVMVSHWHHMCRRRFFRFFWQNGRQCYFINSNI